jgi:hypothetical protein
MQLMEHYSAILAMPGRSNVIAKNHVPIVLLPRPNVFETDTSGRHVRKFEREHSHQIPSQNHLYSSSVN